MAEPSPLDWLKQQANQPTPEFHPIETLTQNLQGLANLPSKVYEGAKQLVTDPQAYFSNIKSPTPEEMAMAFNPAGLEAGLGGIFVGPKSANWNSQMASKAMELESQGVHPKEIWQQTGTFRGPDQKLRQEINDQPSSLDMSKVPTQPSLLQLATQYLRDKGIITRPTQDIASGGIPEEARKEAIDFAQKKLFTATPPAVKLQSAFVHPELYGAYPEFPQLNLSKETRNDIRGQFNPNLDLVTTGGSETLFTKPDEAKSTLLHELQHAIQSKEGFGRGGNPDIAQDLIQKEWSKELEPYYEGNAKFNGAISLLKQAGGAQYIHKLDQLSVADNIKPSQIFNFSDWYKFGNEIRSELGKMPTRPGFQRDEWLRRAAQMMKSNVVKESPHLEEYPSSMNPNEAKNAYQRASRALDKVRPQAQKFSQINAKYKNLSGMEPTEQYKRLSGEAEARATQARMNMTPEERQATFPLESYDVPVNELIMNNRKKGGAINKDAMWMEVQEKKLKRK